MKKQSRRVLKTTVAAIAGLVISSTAHATVFGDGGASLQGILDNITVAPTFHQSSTNVNTDQVGFDSYWQIAASGGSFAQIIIELTGNAGTNTLGIYDASNPSSQVTLFTGAEGAGAQKLLTLGNDGSVFINFADSGIDFSGNAFGYYLDTGNHTFYSDASLNADGIDHMVAYQGKGIDTIDLPSTFPGKWGANEYIMAWEDLFGGGDTDYNDFVVITESVNPIPEPQMLALLGIGLLGFSQGRHKNKA